MRELIKNMSFDTLFKYATMYIEESTKSEHVNLKLIDVMNIVYTPDFEEWLKNLVTSNTVDTDDIKCNPAFTNWY